MYKMKSKILKIVVVGDGGCGKTCLLVAYKDKTFIEKHIPTIFENYSDNVQWEGKDYVISLWDTAGQEAYERLRPLSYGGANLVIVCYAIDCKDSFYNVETVWVPEIKHYCPSAQILIVGNKSDLKSEDECVDPKELKSMINRLRISKFIECSAKTFDNVDLVFSTAVDMILSNQTKKKRKYCKLC